MSESQEKRVTNPPNKTGSGLEQNLAGALCYVLGWLTGIIFLIIEKDNKFVRFHAVQSIIVFGVISVVQIILWIIPVIGWILGTLLAVATFILWILLMYKAYQGQIYKLPMAGDIAEKHSNPAAK
jgi:uncharacterized membrane protein